MIHKKNIIRDVVFVCILVFLMRSISSGRQYSSPVFCYMEENFCSDHKSIDSTKVKHEDSDPIAEPLSVAIQQYNGLLEALKNIHKQTGKHLFCIELTQLKNKVTHVKKEYEKLITKTSKVSMIMGPLGAAATVIKEMTLEKELKHIADYTNVILRNLARNIKKRLFKKLSRFEEVLQQNNEILENL